MKGNRGSENYAQENKGKQLKICYINLTVFDIL